MIITTESKLNSNQLKNVALAISEIDERFNSLNFFGDNVFFLPENLSQNVVKHIKGIKGVEEIYFPPINYQLASKDWRKTRTSFEVKEALVGNNNFQIMAGPCAVESEDQMYKMGETLSKLGINFIRGGAYKPRTSPYSFQGLETEGLKIIRKVADEFNLKVITDAMVKSVKVDEQGKVTGVTYVDKHTVTEHAIDAD
ncbi:MAG: hypothetical protein ACPGLV_02590, partial [Bacteroidia bacterium]